MKPGRDERFWTKVDKTGDCWVWQGCKLRGYGQFNSGGRRGPIVLAHRFSYEISKGKIPEGLFVCHSCDNRACVNPKHLWVGTQSDNMKDCARKGRNFNPRHNLNKTHCPSGHPYSGDNLKLEKSGWRKCRACSNASRMRNYNAKTR